MSYLKYLQHGIALDLILSLIPATVGPIMITPHLNVHTSHKGANKSTELSIQCLEYQQHFTAHLKHMLLHSQEEVITQCLNTIGLCRYSVVPNVPQASSIKWLTEDLLTKEQPISLRGQAFTITDHWKVDL